MDNNIIEIIRECYLIENLLHLSELNKNQINELNLKMSEKFNENDLNKLIDNLAKFNEALKTNMNKDY